MTLQLYYYYYYKAEGSSLVSKVNTRGILAEEHAAESWDCFPKFLAASLATCQSWYLCLIVITPPRADRYLADCLRFPSHFQKEIIKAPTLRRGLQVRLLAAATIRESSCRTHLAPKTRGVICPHQPGKMGPLSSLLLFTQHLMSSSKTKIWVSFSCSKETLCLLSFLQIVPPLRASSLAQVSFLFISLTTTGFFSARHWVTSQTEKLPGWRTVMVMFL